MFMHACNGDDEDALYESINSRGQKVGGIGQVGEVEPPNPVRARDREPPTLTTSGSAVSDRFSD